MSGIRMQLQPPAANPLLVFKLSAEHMSMTAQRDLLEYWGRRKFEGRPTDWT